MPQDQYINALIEEIKAKAGFITNRVINTVFIGGGTPSLFSPEAYANLFSALKQHMILSPHAEITLEANPGTAEARNFQGYSELGINRLSLGIQSFNDEHLKKLGRIHTAREAHTAIDLATDAGFSNFNLDLMFGLPNQSIEQAQQDLQQALQRNPTHLSWYQLTLEPNTLFYKHPPKLPQDDYLWDMQTTGQHLISHTFTQYEISAYAKKDTQCQHNLNYWRFGDYLGIGAGAHSKLSLPHGEIVRHANLKHPRLYLNAQDKIQTQKTLTQTDLPLEFMLNACRLKEKIPFELFETRTGLLIRDIESPLMQAAKLNLLTVENSHFSVTPKGQQYLNELLQIFI